MAQVNTGIIVPLFRKIADGFQKIFISGSNVMLSDNKTTVQDFVNQLGGLKVGGTASVIENLGGTFSLPPNTSPYYRCIQLDGRSNQSADRYFLLIDANGKLFTGRALNGATSITWVEK